MKDAWSHSICKYPSPINIEYHQALKENKWQLWNTWREAYFYPARTAAIHNIFQASGWILQKHSHQFPQLNNLQMPSTWVPNIPDYIEPSTLSHSSFIDLIMDLRCSRASPRTTLANQSKIYCKLQKNGAQMCQHTTKITSLNTLIRYWFN